MNWRFHLNVRKIALYFILLLALSACNSKEKSIDQEKITEKQSSSILAGESLDFEGKSFNLDESRFNLSGAFGNYLETKGMVILYGKGLEGSFDREALLKDIYFNLCTWDVGRFTSEPDVKILEDQELKDGQELLLELGGVNTEFMKSYFWKTSTLNYMLVIGQDKAQVEKLYNEIRK